VKLVATKIHGLCRLPEGYDLMVVHPTATFEHDNEITKLNAKLPLYEKLWKAATKVFRTDSNPKTALCSNYNIIKILVSFIQLLLASSTLYQTQGDQINRYGYAAFGLTVAPYLWMSFINLLANIMCPQFDSIFLVESTDLDSLRAAIQAAGPGAMDQFVVIGTVGRLTPGADVELKRRYKKALRRNQLPLPSEDVSGGEVAVTLITDVNNRDESWTSAFISFVAFLAATVPLAIVGGLSRFQPGQSVVYERVWTMAWLATGIWVGGGLGSVADRIEERPIIGGSNERNPFLHGYMIGNMLWVAPAIGGYVVVGKMIYDFGICTNIS
jgi:hypothetical protein